MQRAVDVKSVGESGMAVGRVAMRVLLQCDCYLTGDLLCIQL